jgi:hypothetical protein
MAGGGRRPVAVAGGRRLVAVAGGRRPVVVAGGARLTSGRRSSAHFWSGRGRFVPLLADSSHCRPPVMHAATVRQ